MNEPARTLIVTGASSGIGRALALAGAKAGFRIVATARRADRLEELVREIRSARGACIAIAGDVTARDMPARIVEAATNAFERIDVVVNNAGLGAYGALLEISDAEIEAQWQLHVGAPIRLARAALPQLEATRGQLVFIGSGIVRVPLPRYGGYAPAKAAIRAAAIQLRRELRSKGIAVTYVDPGVVASEFHSRLGIKRTVNLVASPEQAARAILRGIRHRSAVVNAVKWQTAFSTIGEWVGTLADPIIIRSFTNQPAAVDETVCHPERRPEGPQVKVEGRKDNFDAALEPVARRMERVKLPASFLREAMSPGATLELNALAMRWAGMPNKNERAVLREALDALAAGGFLEPAQEETWRVLRAAD